MSDVSQVAGDQLRSIIERVERTREQMKELKEDEKEIFAEAKGNGFSVAVLKKIIADRAKDPNEVSEFEAIYSLYAGAIGMQTSINFGGEGE